jgi:hypothetical protein
VNLRVQAPNGRTYPGGLCESARVTAGQAPLGRAGVGCGLLERLGEWGTSHDQPPILIRQPHTQQTPTAGETATRMPELTSQRTTRRFRKTRGIIRTHPSTPQRALSHALEDLRIWLDVAQVAALAEAIGPRFRALVLVVAYAGLRWGGLVAGRLLRGPGRSRRWHAGVRPHWRRPDPTGALVQAADGAARRHAPGPDLLTAGGR